MKKSVEGREALASGVPHPGEFEESDEVELVPNPSLSRGVNGSSSAAAGGGGGVVGRLAALTQSVTGSSSPLPLSLTGPTTPPGTPPNNAAVANSSGVSLSGVSFEPSAGSPGRASSIADKSFDFRAVFRKNKLRIACAALAVVVFIVLIVVCGVLLAPHAPSAAAAAPQSSTATTTSGPATAGPTPAAGTPTPQVTDARWLLPTVNASLVASAPNSSAIAFDAAMTKEWLRNFTVLLLSYGPRVAGSDSTGYREAFAMLQAMAGCDGTWSESVDTFTEDTVLGSKTFNNIVASFSGGDVTNGNIVLAAHFDSKLFTDGARFVGASDSAVPCVMILQLMRRLSTAMAVEKRLGVSRSALPKVTAMFFDGEEAFVAWRGADNTYGSRHLAAAWAASGQLQALTLFVLLDLIGPSGPQFHNYFPLQSGPYYTRLGTIFNNMRTRGTLLLPNAANYFPPDDYSTSTVEDDHIPWLQRGVPILHLIPVPFPVVWHTPQDDETAVDYATTTDLTNAVWQLLIDAPAVKRGALRRMQKATGSAKR